MYDNPAFGLGMRMLAHGGPTLTPTNTMQQAGQAGLGFMQGRRALMQEAMQRKIQEKKLEAMEQELKTAQRERDIADKYADLYANYFTGAEGVEPGSQQSAMLSKQMQGMRNPQGLGQLMFQQGAEMGQPSMMSAGLGQMTPTDPLEDALTRSKIAKNLYQAKGGGKKITRSDRLMQLSRKMASGIATPEEQREYYLLNTGADPITLEMVQGMIGAQDPDPLGILK